MSEEFLYYIWSQKLFNPELETTKGETLVVESTGFRNDDSGPDFSDARIRIGETLWAGNVEIHVKASDWFKHNHESDPAYQNIVLHIVYECDVEIDNTSREHIPCVELKGAMSRLLYHKWKNLIDSKKWVPCEGSLKQVPDLIKSNTLDRLLIERFESKVSAIDESLKRVNQDWEVVFFRALAENFGFHVNGAPFEILARSFDYRILQKLQHDPILLEALLFGQAGLLNENLSDEYNQKLVKEYDYLQHKHQLQPMLGHTWKFMRMRPVNFPSIRIAQLAALYNQQQHLFSKVLECHSIDQLGKLFDIQASSYWDSHYTFGKPSKQLSKKLGQGSFELLLINTIAPFLFVYGRQQLKDEISERALEFLYQVPAEVNSVIKKWTVAGMKAKHAGQSQALLQLKKHYCAYTKCLDCQIGNYIISSNHED